MRNLILTGMLVLSCLMVPDLAQAGGNRWNRRFNWLYHAHQPSGCLAVPYNDQEKAVICMSRPVPPNWIIVGVRHTVNCNGLGNNAWTIQKIPTVSGAEMIICQGQPIPEGWKVIAEVHNVHCGHANAVLIKKL